MTRSKFYCRELLLIDGLLASGMGSWADAAEHVGSRSKEEVEAHYQAIYVASDEWPMPVRSLLSISTYSKLNEPYCSLLFPAHA